MDGSGVPPPLFIFSQGCNDDDDNDDDDNDKDDDDEKPVVTVACDSEPVDVDIFITRAVLSRLTSSLSFRSFSSSRFNSSLSLRRLSLSRLLDNDGRDGDLSLDHNDDEDFVLEVVLVEVEVVVVVSAEGDHDEKLVRNKDIKGLDERGWMGVSLDGPSLLFMKESCRVVAMREGLNTN